MLALSNARFPPVDIGRNVVSRVPDVHCGRLAPRSTLAVVCMVNADGMYELGTKEGHLDHLCAHNEFSIADSDFITVKEALFDV